MYLNYQDNYCYGCKKWEDCINYFGCDNTFDCKKCPSFRCSEYKNKTKSDSNNDNILKGDEFFN